MKKQILLLLSLTLYTTLAAQLFGTISDEQGEVLPFANVYVKGSSLGTTSNIKGYYSFDLDPGDYFIVFQYVGYKPSVQEVKVTKGGTPLDVQLETESILIPEVLIKADSEDPAYAIIRKAMAKRKYYRDLVNTYQCKVYLKGMQRMIDAPEKIFGRELGDMGGHLDSNRQGIIYLSESESILHVQAPDHKKEEMISSKVSGDAGAFSFNRATFLEFNFYNNTLTIEREIISPIASMALAYYTYRLIGTFFDGNGNLINKIEVIPKRKADPVFRGYLYIVDEYWNIHSTNLYLIGTAMNQPLLDTLQIRQVYAPVASPDTWLQLSQSMTFSFRLMSFTFQGDFHAVYSDYVLNPVYPDDFFANEVFKVTEGANQKNNLYWDTIRPIPLSPEEMRDYNKKDSLQSIWTSDWYLDSMDQKNNRFAIMDLLGGYHYQHTKKRRYLSLSSPLTSVLFNPVQGLYTNASARYQQDYDDYNGKWWQLFTTVQYGFGDHRWRGTAGLTYQFNHTNFAKLEITGGRSAKQFNDSPAILPVINAVSALWFKNNYSRLYDQQFGKIQYSQEIRNGLEIKTSTVYARREPLVNRSNFSLYRRDEVYLENIPVNESVEDPVFQKHKAWLIEVILNLRFDQKYMTYPGRKINLSSKWPELSIRYTKGLPFFGSDLNFDKGAIVIKDKIGFGAWGFSRYQMSAGTIFQQDSLPFMDYQHFNGNQTFIGLPASYLGGFKALDYYTHSTSYPYVQVNYEHQFKGVFLDKVPLIRRLQWELVATASMLYTQEYKDYFELGLAVENIGFKTARIFRVDVLSSFDRGIYQGTKLLVGVNFQ